MPSAEGHSAVLLAAGDVDGYARNEIGIGRCQKANHAGLILGLGNTSEGRAGNFCGLLSLRHLLPARMKALAQRATGRNGITGDAVRAELERELPSEGDNTAFRSRVGTATTQAETTAGNG